jgi:addiction module HigA family antidote
MLTTKRKLAEAMGVQRKHVNELCNDRRNVTAATALILARVFGNSPDFWLNVQWRTDLWEAMHSARDRKRIERARPLKAADGRRRSASITGSRLGAMPLRGVREIPNPLAGAKKFRPWRRSKNYSHYSRLTSIRTNSPKWGMRKRLDPSCFTRRDSDLARTICRRGVHATTATPAGRLFFGMSFWCGPSCCGHPRANPRVLVGQKARPPAWCLVIRRPQDTALIGMRMQKVRKVPRDCAAVPPP